MVFINIALKMAKKSIKIEDFHKTLCENPADLIDVGKLTKITNPKEMLLVKHRVYLRKFK